MSTLKESIELPLEPSAAFDVSSTNSRLPSMTLG
jgi:hypothetical protein